MSALLPAERGTRMFFGKAYHWHRENGVLVLVAMPYEDCAAHDHEPVIL